MSINVPNQWADGDGEGKQGKAAHHFLLQSPEMDRIQSPRDVGKYRRKLGRGGEERFLSYIFFLNSVDVGTQLISF